jgi:hypothetical protein
MNTRTISAIRFVSAAAFASAFGSAGAPLVVAAAGITVLDDDPPSLRTNANAVHNKGSTPGDVESSRTSSQDDSLSLRPETDPRGGADVITGAAGVAAAAAVTTFGGMAEGPAAEEAWVAAVPWLPPVDEFVRCSRSSTSGGGRVEAAMTGEGASAVGFVLPRDAGGLSGAVRRPGDRRVPGAESESASASGAEADDEVPLRGSVVAAASRSDPVRAPARGPRGTLVDSPDDGWDWSPVEPAEPVVSAYDMGIAAIAEPTPNATARAPTRPT